ncbi:MAG: DUF5658 family protein [Desulfosporosinus sp.]|nr:DUF5658 family protein [Desulfosporosinus sp.]
MDKRKLIIAGCTVLFLLSLLDGALTLWGLRIDAIEEVNPVMQWLTEKSRIAFMAVKLSLLVILGFIFWRIRNRSRKFVVCLLGLVLIVYSVVIGLHVYRVVLY